MQSGFVELAMPRTLLETLMRWPARWSSASMKAAVIDSAEQERTAAEWTLFLDWLDGARSSVQPSLAVATSRQSETRLATVHCIATRRRAAG